MQLEASRGVAASFKYDIISKVLVSIKNLYSYLKLNIHKLCKLFSFEYSHEGVGVRGLAQITNKLNIQLKNDPIQNILF